MSNLKFFKGIFLQILNINQKNLKKYLAIQMGKNVYNFISFYSLEVDFIDNKEYRDYFPMKVNMTHTAHFAVIHSYINFIGS